MFLQRKSKLFTMKLSIFISIVLYGFVDGAEPSVNRLSQKKCREFYSNVKSVQFAEPSTKGREFAESGEFPYIASIGWQKTDGSIFYDCGGLLISNNYVLAVGRCGLPQKDLGLPKFITIGNHNLNSLSGKNLHIPIKNIIVHPERTNDPYYDIALFELANSVQTTPACLWTHKIPDACLFDHNKMKDICVNRDNKIKDDESTIIFYERDNTTASKLAKIRAKLEPITHCTEIYNTHRNLPVGISSTQLCASEYNLEDCRGNDDAQLLIQEKSDGKWIPYVVGIGKSLIPCSEYKYNLLFTKIPTFVEWIEGIVWPNF